MLFGPRWQLACLLLLACGSIVAQAASKRRLSCRASVSFHFSPSIHPTSSFSLMIAVPMSALCWLMDEKSGTSINNAALVYPNPQYAATIAGSGVSFVMKRVAVFGVG